MTRTLNTIGRALRSNFIPKSVSYKVWRSATRANDGQSFFFKTALFQKPLTYGGVCGASDDALFLNLEESERDVIPVLKTLLSMEAVPELIDVGANNGAFMVTVKTLDPRARVHCFEPFPQLAGFLADLVHHNSFQNVFVNNFLVGETDEARNLYFTKGTTVTASVVKDFQAAFDTQLEAKQRSLDSYVSEKHLNHVSLIKIDVEGGELEVIQGATRTLTDLRPKLILEILYTENEEHGSRQRIAVELLKQLGYRFYQIQDGGRLLEQEKVAPDPEYRFVNYLLSTTDVSGLQTTA